MSEKTQGHIQIANDVLADLAGFAAMQGYGVVAMASPTLADGVAKLLPAHKLRKGVRISNGEEGVSVDLYVVIEHGTNIAEVSHQLASGVRYALTDTADVAVARVDVHVMGVNVRQVKR